MMRPRRLGAPDLALDLGTAQTRLASQAEPLLIERTSALEFSGETNGALAVLRDVEHPIEHGVVVDVEGAARLLAPQVRLARGYAPFKPRMLVCHPSDASSEERGRLLAAVLLAGAGAVRLAEEPVAAVLGATPADAATRARLVVDLGEGVTDIAVVQNGQILASAAARLGLAEIRQRVRQEVLDEHGVLLRSGEILALLVQPTEHGEWLSVERILGRREKARPDGRRVLRHLVFVRRAVVARVLEGVLEAIGQRVAGLLGSLGGGEVAAVTHEGVLLTGGGSFVQHLSRGMAGRLGLAVQVAPDPLHAVIAGARRLLRERRGDEWLTSADAPQAYAPLLARQ